MAAKKSERGSYITCIGMIDTKDPFLLDLLISNGFLLEKSERTIGKFGGDKKLEWYKIYMEDLDA